KSSEENTLGKKETDDEPPAKKLKFLIPSSSIPSPTPLKSIMPKPPKVTKAIKITLDQFTEHLSKTTSSIFSPTPLRESNPPRNKSKGKGITESGESHVSAQGMKRLSDLKAEKEKLEQELRKMFNQATLKAQAQKWTKHEITKGDNPLNLVVYPNFRLKMLGFNEWLEVHALASKKYGKSNYMLLQSLREKFQWVIDQAKKLGLPPPPALATFGMIAEDKKRKRTEFLKEVFVTENITVNGMQRNLIPPPRVVPIEGLVINKPKS
ncbi:hypothetical protein Tco_0784464, partial [Tanacetum coccineum]